MDPIRSKDVIPEHVIARVSSALSGSGKLGEIIVEDGVPAFIVHGYPHQLQTGDIVQDASPKATMEPRNIQGPTWFFWIDLAPRQPFTHRTLYVYVDVETLEVAIDEGCMWPRINDKGWLISGGDPQDTSTWIYAEEF